MQQSEESEPVRVSPGLSGLSPTFRLGCLSRAFNKASQPTGPPRGIYLLRQKERPKVVKIPMPDFTVPGTEDGDAEAHQLVILGLAFTSLHGSRGRGNPEDLPNGKCARYAYQSSPLFSLRDRSVLGVIANDIYHTNQSMELS